MPSKRRSRSCLRGVRLDGKCKKKTGPKIRRKKSHSPKIKMGELIPTTFFETTRTQNNDKETLDFFKIQSSLDLEKLIRRKTQRQSSTE